MAVYYHFFCWFADAVVVVPFPKPDARGCRIHPTRRFGIASGCRAIYPPNFGASLSPGRYYLWTNILFFFLSVAASNKAFLPPTSMPRCVLKDVHDTGKIENHSIWVAELRSRVRTDNGSLGEAFISLRKLDNGILFSIPLLGRFTFLPLLLPVSLP